MANATNIAPAPQRRSLADIKMLTSPAKIPVPIDQDLMKLKEMAAGYGISLQAKNEPCAKPDSRMTKHQKKMAKVDKVLAAGLDGMYRRHPFLTK